MNGKIGIGFIGTGFARKVQMPCFAECEGAFLASAASHTAENAAAAAREFGIAHHTDDWRETIARPDVDLVCITTPPDVHYEQTLAALANGKHVLCEKPMAMNAATAAEMTEKASEKGVLALIDHELRFQDGRLKAFEMLRNGAIGAIRHVKHNFRAPQRGDANLPWNWWSDASRGGGALGAIGSHIIDSFNWLTGAEISQVFCQLQSHIKERADEKTGAPRGVTSDDEANLIVRFNDGELTRDATGIISISMVEQPEYLNRLELFGTTGALRIGHLGELFVTKDGEKDWTRIETNLGKAVEGVGDTGFSRGFRAFAPVIVKALLADETKIEHAATFADGVKVQKVIDAAHESNDTRKVVTLG